MKYATVLITGLICIAAAAMQPASSSPELPPQIISDAMDEADCLLSMAEMQEVSEPAKTLDENHMILEVPCWRAAYQTGSIFLVYEAGAPESARLLHFAVPEGDGFARTASLTFPDYDPEGARITSLHRARGPGDCGSAGSWLWSGDAFVLDAYWRKDDCDGRLFDPLGEPETWRVYP